MGKNQHSTDAQESEAHHAALQFSGAAANDSGRSNSFDQQPSARTLTWLPGAQHMYRALNKWLQEFVPRRYERAPIYIQHTNPPRRRRGLQR